MLWLERLEVNGFKSFSDSSCIEFPQGITAVVGPNGCGKSNIGDAIQWVLGEQSARALRGQRMEDLIFAGTQGRSAGGMAEVSLHLVARDEPLRDGRDRVTLTRRLFRTGVSEYLIDGKRSRLVDVRALLDHVRAGVRSYAIVDQAHVAAFVVSKPRDRRVFIEEAAGIAGYKVRRRTAELKLEATRANLLRVDDIVREVERQQRSLKRQASLARRARRLDERLRALRTVWYRRQDEELSRQVERSGEELGVAQRETGHLDRERERLGRMLALSREELEHAHGDREQAVERAHAERLEEERLERGIAAALTQAAALEDEAGRRAGEGEALALERQRREDEIAGLMELARRLDGDLSEVAERVAAAKEVVDRERGEHERLRGEAAALETALFEVVHRKVELSARLSAAAEAARREEKRSLDAEAARRRLEEAVALARRQRDSAVAVTEQASSTIERLELEVHQAQRGEEEAWAALEAARSEDAALARELSARSGEKEALDSLTVRLAGADAAREVLEQARGGKLRARQVIADVLKAEKEVERAAELFLGDLLPTVLVDSSDEVRKGAALGIQGKVRYLPLDAPGREPGQNGGGGRLPREMASYPGVRGRLTARLKTNGGLGEAVAARLQDAVLVDSLEVAFELHRRYPEWNYLTPEGHTVHANGMVTVEGGLDEEQGGLLTRARRREELTRAVEELERRRDRAVAAVEQVRERHRTCQVVRRRLEEELAQARRDQASAAMQLEQLEREISRLRHEAEMAAEAKTAAEEGFSQARERAAVCAEEQEGIEAQITAGREALEGARGKVRAHEESVRRAEASYGELVSDQRALVERGSAHRRELERLRQELAAVDQRREEGRRARQSAGERAEALRITAEEEQRRLEGVGRERSDLEREVEAWAGRLAAMSDRVHRLESRLDRVGEELEQARGRREAAALEAEKARMELEHERESCREELGCAPGELPRKPPGDLEPEVLGSDLLLRQELQAVRGKRDRLGTVNLLAEQEFEELSARYEALSGQRQDLMRSVEELGDSIKRMNRESRERFLEAFHAIRRHFREQFMTLFRGGQGDLHLEDEDNVLESGIEIMCQPPGKKLQSVNLLSGGEKALAATALLFAIFDFQPPPFCLLDEIDAPLDDTNVHRFTEAVREFAHKTQIILITHNKRSMETADVLYGVTMPEPGISKLVSMAMD